MGNENCRTRNIGMLLAFAVAAVLLAGCVSAPKYGIAGSGTDSAQQNAGQAAPISESTEDAGAANQGANAGIVAGNESIPGENSTSNQSSVSAPPIQVDAIANTTANGTFANTTANEASANATLNETFSDAGQFNISGSTDGPGNASGSNESIAANFTPAEKKPANVSLLEYDFRYCNQWYYFPMQAQGNGGYCLWLGIDSGDTGLCNLVPEGGNRDVCLIGVAINNANSTICDGLPQEKERRDCRLLVGRKIAGEYDCSKLPAPDDGVIDPYGAHGYINSDLCYYYKGVAANDTSICSMISGGSSLRAECLGQTATKSAIAKNDATICELVENNQSRAYCYAVAGGATGAPWFCEKETGDGRDRCISAAAAMNSNISLCGGISNAAIRENCALVASDQSSCAHIASLNQRNKCYYESALRESDVKKCNMIYSDGSWDTIDGHFVGESLVEPASEKHACAREVAVKTHDISLCGMAGNYSYYVQWCYQNAAADLSAPWLCMLYNDSGGLECQDAAYALLAQKTGNPQSCGKIQNEQNTNFRENCMLDAAETARDASICGAIPAGSYYSPLCYSRLAALTGNASLCALAGAGDHACNSETYKEISIKNRDEKICANMGVWDYRLQYSKDDCSIIIPGLKYLDAHYVDG